MKKLVLAIAILSYYRTSAQTGSEIFLFDLKVNNEQVVISNGKNITNHKGYDNQPSFHPSNPVIYYSSFNDSGRSDLRYYDYQKKLTTDFVITEDDREYSPTVRPGEQWISCIIQRLNGDQDLGMYPASEDKKPVVLINNLKIGYHAWVDKERLLLFVLGDSNTNSLHYYNLKTKKDTVIASNIGRSLHKVPGEGTMSFVQKTGDKQAMIKRFDPETTKVTDIVATIPGQDHLTWLQNNILLMSDGTKLFSFQIGKDTVWKPVTVEGDISMLKGITRLATNINDSMLAVVVSE